MKARWVPRVKPGRNYFGDQRRKAADFYTFDQRLLAEIRDLLIEVLNEQNDTGVAIAVQRLERRMAAQQAAVEQLTAALEAVQRDRQAL